MMADLATCELKAYYSFQRKLGSLEPSIDLIAGGAFARGLEVTRLLFYGEKLPLHSALEAGMMAAIESYGTTICPEHKAQKDVNRVITALAAYFDKYPPATDYIQPMYTADGKPLVEFTFSIPLPVLHPETGEPIIYAGRFDMVGLYNTQVVAVDEKTTSQLGPTWKNKWALRGQFTGYCWAAQQYGRPVVGAIVRGVSFLKNSHGFEESIQMRPQWMIDQWYAQMIHRLRSWIHAWETNWYNQDLGDACADYSGCPFLRLCTSSDPENWVEGHYGIREWDPLHKVPYVQPEQKVEIVQAPDDLLALMEKG